MEDIEKFIESMKDYEKLIKALSHHQQSFRKSAVEELGDLGDKRAVEHLIKIWNGYSQIRESVAEALGKIGDERAVEPLINAYKTRQTPLRESIVVALGEIGGEQAITFLTELLNSRSWEFNYYLNSYEYELDLIVWALQELGGKRVIESFIRLLESKSSVVTVGTNPSTFFVSSSNYSLNSDEAIIQIELHQRIILTLGEFRDKRAVRPLIIKLRDRHRIIRNSAIKALGWIGDESAIDPMIQLWKDQRKTSLLKIDENLIVVALGEIGGEDALRILRHLRDADSIHSKAAAKAIEKIISLNLEDD